MKYTDVENVFIDGSKWRSILSISTFFGEIMDQSLKNIQLAKFYYNLLWLIFQEDSLWACLAAMAAYAKELATAEVAYAAIDEVHTVLGVIILLCCLT